jgi:hypothetical protein
LCNDCAFGVCANEDHQDPTRDHDATGDHTSDRQMTTGAVAVGTVTAFTPGKTTVTPPSPIVVQSSPDAKPVSYVLGRKVRYVAKDAKQSTRT